LQRAFGMAGVGDVVATLWPGGGRDRLRMDGGVLRAQPGSPAGLDDRCSLSAFTARIRFLEIFGRREEIAPWEEARSRIQPLLRQPSGVD